METAMTISLTHHERQLLMERLQAAEAMDRPQEVVTVLYVTEIHVQQRYE